VSEPWNQPWFWPALLVTIGLPIALVVCTELARLLDRRGSRAASIVRLVRNFALPLGALLLLLSQVDDLQLEVNWTRIVATIFGFVLILVAINLLNFAIFTSAERGSWRQRIPSIFIDIIRLVVIVVCFALLFQWVWGADVGGLFTALGVTSIVIGLALQNAAGSVVSGLLLLFEQPFRLGDWLQTGTVRGRVVEVNWRAVHIDTGNGTYVVPTASLAGSAFTNLSRVTGSYEAQTTLAFSKTDAPTDVARLIVEVASDLPLRLPDSPVAVTPAGAGSYQVSVAVARPADEGPTIALLLGWLWFAARRAGLHLDGETGDATATPERRATAVRRVAQRLGLSEEEAAILEDRGTIERFGSGETISRAGAVAPRLRFIVDGRVSLQLRVEGRVVDYHDLTAPEAVGLGVYTRLPEPDTARAATVVTTFGLARDVVEQFIARHPRLAVELGRAGDHRRQLQIAAREKAEAAIGAARPLA
jgi:small-conductance mechanosensitive channel/CRP-like cAMP-binding protein